MKLLITISVFASAICAAYGMCNTCSLETNLACVDTNKFKICVDGLPKPPAISCPSGTICTPNAQVCSPPSATVEPSCNMCKKCNEAKTFGCTGYNTFALCYGTDSLDEITNFMCPNDLVCNIESPYICIDRNTTGIGSTCSWSTMATTTTTPEPTEATTTTVDPVTSPNKFCESKAVHGRYDVISDSTCKQYINCYQSNGVWYGNIYICPSSTYFNSNSQVCGINKPSRCAIKDEVCD